MQSKRQQETLQIKAKQFSEKVRNILDDPKVYAKLCEHVEAMDKSNNVKQLHDEGFPFSLVQLTQPKTQCTYYALLSRKDSIIGKGLFGSAKFSYVFSNEAPREGNLRVIKKIKPIKRDDVNVLQSEAAFTHSIFGIFGCANRLNNKRVSVGYIDMPFVGVNLEIFLKENGSMLATEARFLIVFNLVNALADLHQKGIVHRDIKIENITIDPMTFRVSIIDYGFAKDIKMGLSGYTCGTPAYLAPDIDEKIEDEKVDIYALSLVIALIMGGNVDRILINKLNMQDKIKQKFPSMPAPEYHPGIRQASYVFDSLFSHYNQASQALETLKQSLSNILKKMSARHSERTHLYQVLLALHAAEKEYYSSSTGKVLMSDALNLAAYNNQVGVIAYLLKKGVDVNFITDSDCAALHVAAYRGHIAAVKLLLANDADPLLLNDKKQTPISLAKSKGHHNIIELLQQSQQKRLLR